MEEEPPIYRLPHDTLHQIFSTLPLRQIILCRTLSKFFHHLLSTPSFLHLLAATHPPLHLLALRHHHPHSHPLHLFDPELNTWLHFPLHFLPFHSPLPVASSHGLLYLWAQPNPPRPNSPKSLISCNPLTRQFRILPHLGSAWSRHGSVLVDSANRVMVLTELAALYCNNSSHWLKFSSNLPSKPRSPLLIGDSAFALCDVGSPWRSQWKLYSCRAGAATAWSRLERHEWGDVFDILKRPRLVRGHGNRILMVGGLKSSFSLNSPCSTILVLRLNLDSLEWDEAARMPPEMFRCFQESSKFKVFGAGDRVCFSAKRIGKLALWDRRAAKGEEWRWIDNLPGNADGLYRGFVFEGRVNAVP
ncbi:SKP1-interacting partner 15 [Abrus precatorius]|uniref:SKP1-interacting partner 15 n=1 Tax=Abrus precatorius TaxID=3816 RepID=A0A8B8LS33_ABRPR|nr:SKP1-interacting partner 15 [Abrus precatorius]